MNYCKPLEPGNVGIRQQLEKKQGLFRMNMMGRVFHSSTSQLNVSAFCGIGGAFGVVQGVLGGVTGYLAGV